MDTVFQHIDNLENSQNQLTRLIEQLDRETRQTQNAEVNELITGMESSLGQFSDNHFELQREIEELLENSRRGALSHEKLAEMVNAEQVRSSYLSNIVNSLKSQVENLFSKLITATNDDEISDPGEIVEHVSNNVNLLWKSVDSLSKLIASPTKKLEYNIQKIDSEVIVHLNKTLHLHDKTGSNNNTTTSVTGSEMNFSEKVEKAVKSKKAGKKLSNLNTGHGASRQSVLMSPKPSGNYSQLRFEVLFFSTFR
jgi:predicted  nucleic acid-binding Zn-ribbon protein